MKRKITMLIGVMGLVIMLGVTCAYGGVRGDTVYMEMEFPEPKITSSTYSPEYSHIEMEGTRSLGEVGEPVLPVKGLKVLIPSQTKVKDIEIILGEKVILPGIYTIEPGQKEYPLSQIDKIEIKPDKPKPQIYEADTPYPGKLHKLVSLQKKMGYPIVMLELYPVEYNPKKGEIAYYKKMTVVVRLKTDTTRFTLQELKGVARLRTQVKIKEKDRAVIYKLIDNQEDLSVYDQGLTSLTPETTSLLGGIDPLLQYDYVIITHTNFVASFEPLKQRRIQKGLTATIVTTDWIYANYSGTRPQGGEDNQTKIRNFILDAYNNWGTRYVLLAGDGDGASVGGESGNNIIPARGLYHSGYGYTDNNIPADLYYACLDGTFDHNANGIYGERTDGETAGEVDLLAEVYIGRAAVDSVAEADNFVRKTLTYEDSTDNYLTNNYMVGEYLGFGGVSQYATESMEEIRLGSSAHGYATQGFLSNPDGALDAGTLYDSSSSSWPKSQLINIINNGVHILNHLGHANVEYDMKLYNTDVNSLTNTKYFIVYSQGCYPGSFDNRTDSNSYSSSDCIAEHFTGNSTGAVAFIGNSRYGWGMSNSTAGSSQYYDRQFWDALFAEGITQLARMNQDSKEDNIPYLNWSMNRWCYFELNLFGDPALEVHLPNALILHLSNSNFIEEIGDGDGLFEPGETVELTVTLRALNQDASNVFVTLSSSDSYVTIAQDNASYGTILKGESQSNLANPLRFTISTNCPVGRRINFTLTITANSYTKERNLSIETSDPRERRITTNTASQYYPAISGERIVWEDYRNGNIDIYLYSLSTNTEHQITAHTVPQTQPAISGDRIVWQDYRNGNDDIYLYDLSTNSERQITTNTASQSYPAISGERIVWHDSRNGNWDIYLYDLSTNTERQITTNTASQAIPAISGERIVWHDYRNGNWDIYLYDLSTNSERRITTNTATQCDPVISGERIVWDDSRNGNYDIYLYDLSTNSERQITTSIASQFYPVISGDWIVWHDYRNGNYDIYLYDLGDITPPIIPVVNDEGNYTNSTASLSANWSSQDPESGIVEYQYRITEDSISGSVIRDWTSSGINNTVTAGGLSLTVGKTYYFGVKAKNGAGLWSEVGYSDGITVVINNPPVLAPIGNKTTDENVKLEFTISATDPDGDTLTYLANNLPAGATFNPITRIFSWTSTSTQAGIYGNISFTVSDGLFSDSETITITVNNVNRPPVLNPIGSKTVKANSLLTFTISGSDPDGGVLTYSAANLPSGATFNSSTRVFSWKPSRKQIGVYANVTFRVSDGQLIDSEAITITVTR